MTQNFDFYEYAGVIVPGSVLILGAALVEPAVQMQLEEGVSFGEFGVFVIIAYAAGQLVQGVGTMLERPVWWLAGGLPNRKMLAGDGITPAQHARLRR